MSATIINVRARCRTAPYWLISQSRENICVPKANLPAGGSKLLKILDPSLDVYCKSVASCDYLVLFLVK